MKSMAVMGFAMSASVLTYIVIFNIFVWPIEEEWRNEAIKEYCPNGLETCTLTLEPSWLTLLPIIPALGVYVVIFCLLSREKKVKEKTWRSYK